MGLNQDDAYAPRRAELDGLYRALPKTNTTAYWHRIEEDVTPLEVLARCCRERLAAAAAEDADRIFAVIARRCQSKIGAWAGMIANTAHAGMRRQLHEDLQQECYLKLWEDLKDDGPTFLLENFFHALGRVQQHVASDVMQREGEWQRKDVDKSTRIPRNKIDSAEATKDRKRETPLLERLSHPDADADFARADLSDLLDLVRELPADQRTIIHDRFAADRPQEETADKLGISTRMVRYRLQTILHALGVRYHGGEGGSRG